MPSPSTLRCHRARAALQAQQLFLALTHSLYLSLSLTLLSCLLRQSFFFFAYSLLVPFGGGASSFQFGVVAPFGLL